MADDTTAEGTEVLTGDLLGAPLPGLVTLAEAAEGWQVSVRTLRRRIADGKLPGAVLRDTPAGEAWHVVPVELDQLYPRRGTDVSTTTKAGAPALAGELAQLVQLLDDHRQAVEARRLAEVEAAELRTRVAALEELREADAARLADAEELRRVEREALEGERNRLAAELERARRPWWRRL